MSFNYEAAKKVGNEFVYAIGTQLTEAQILEQTSPTLSFTDFVGLDWYNRISRDGVVLSNVFLGDPVNYPEYLVFARVEHNKFVRADNMRTVADYEMRQWDSTRESYAREKCDAFFRKFEDSPDAMERYLGIYFGKKLKLYAVLKAVDPATGKPALRFDYAFD